MYIELHTASAFSFLEGTTLPENIVGRAAELNYPALALLDRDGVYGAPRFHRAAMAAGIKPIIGCELTIGESEATLRRRESDSESDIAFSGFQRSRTKNHGKRRDLSRVWRLPVLVESREGYRNLCRVITRMKMSMPKGAAALILDDLEGYTRGLVALIGRPLLTNRQYGMGDLLDRLVGLFGRSNVYVELQRHLLRNEETDNQTLIALASAFHVPIVATNGVRFSTYSERSLYDVLTCIRHKTTLDCAGRRLEQNSERYLKSPIAMTHLFHDLPKAVNATLELTERLSYTMADLSYRFPEYPVPSEETTSSFLRRIVELGVRDRYRPYYKRARQQVMRELDLIQRLDLSGYFLIVWDIVNFCRQHDILVQGRGSAANSAVCYSLGITAVDPVGMDLLFERFLSEERKQWPDIDLDLPSGDRRERVIQYVYERYGCLGTGMTASVITYQGRSAARDVGKVLAIETGQISQLVKAMNTFECTDPRDTMIRCFNKIGFSPDDPRIHLFGKLWHDIQDLPRHLGQHSGGMVIGQGRLDDVVPLENATMPGRVVVQWDKDDCAAMGIMKVDLLGLGMMSVLQDTLAVVNSSASETKGQQLGALVDLAHLPPDDPAVYRMLREADTIGVFQVESRAQMAMLPRMKPERFYDIVVEVAIIRPGPIVGQMVHSYLRRRAGEEPVTYPHSSLEPILRRTLGVPLFQEQLLRIAMVAAGFSGSEAEELRRSFGSTRSKSLMKQIEEKLRKGMEGRGIVGIAAEQIIQAITSFALYGFPESHAASFALLVYASAYLKAHFPAAFYAAILNNQPMGFYRPATLVKDAQRHGVRFAGIDVQNSNWSCTVETNGTIRLGLKYVKGLREGVARTIEHVQRSIVKRDPSGIGSQVLTPSVHPPTLGSVQSKASKVRFYSLDDLIARTGLQRDELATLAEIGALNSFGYDRRGALWQIEYSIRPVGELFKESPGVKDLPQCSTFSVQGLEPRTKSRLSDGQSPLPRMTPSERLVADYRGTGLTIGLHPMAFWRAKLTAYGVFRAIDLPRVRNGRYVRVAGMVITRQRPETAKGFVFLTLEDETGLSNVVLQPDLHVMQRTTIVEESFLLVEGLLQIKSGAISIRADWIQGLDSEWPEIGSHDFH